jgi:hypothetical protein
MEMGMSIHILFIFAKNRKQNGQAGKWRIKYNRAGVL